MRIDETVVKQVLGEACYELQEKAFHKGVDQAGKVFENAYRNILMAVHDDERKPGGPNFAVAFQSVTKKTVDFKSGIGSYCVVGIEMVGGRPKAPQARFNENGTKERFTKAGHYRGRVEARRWLASALEAWADQAREAMMRTIQHHVDLANSSNRG